MEILMKLFKHLLVLTICCSALSTLADNNTLTDSLTDKVKPQQNVSNKITYEINGKVFGAELSNGVITKLFRNGETVYENNDSSNTDNVENKVLNLALKIKQGQKKDQQLEEKQQAIIKLQEKLLSDEKELLEVLNDLMDEIDSLTSQLSR